MQLDGTAGRFFTIVFAVITDRRAGVAVIAPTDQATSTEPSHSKINYLVATYGKNGENCRKELQRIIF